MATFKETNNNNNSSNIFVCMVYSCECEEDENKKRMYDVLREGEGYKLI